MRSGLRYSLGLRGEFGIAIPLGAFGLGLLGWVPFGPAGFAARTQKSAGQTSRVRSAFLEMELDHDSGAMRGRVLAGRHQGAALEQLDVETLVAMLERDRRGKPRATWWLILTAGIPAGVSTRRRTRQRGGARRAAEK